MVKQYTVEEIKELTKVFSWKLRTCSICDHPIGYHIHPERERVAFDSSCECNRINGWEERSWADIAESVNMQSSQEVQDRMISELRGEAK